MNTIRDFLNAYQIRAREQSGLRTLRSLQEEFCVFVKEVPQRRTRLSDGGLPFCQFSNWIARQYGKSKKSIYGRWTRYDGSLWRIIGDQYGDGEAGYDAFIMLLNNFLNIRISRTCVATLASMKANASDEMAAIEGWACSEKSGCLMNLVYPDGRTTIEGFYSSIEELLQSAETQYRVPMDAWVYK
jgi:hypothetical protein